MAGQTIWKKVPMTHVITRFESGAKTWNVNNKPYRKEQVIMRRERNLEFMKNYDARGLNFIKACESGDAEAVQTLFDEAKAIPLNMNKVYAMQPWILMSLPLAAAVQAGSEACVRILLSHGADPDVKCQRCGKTPRELAENTPLAETFNSISNNKN